MEAYEPGDVRKDVSVGFVTAHGISYPYIKKYCHAQDVYKRQHL